MARPCSEALEPLLEMVIVDDHLHLPDMFQLSLRDVDLKVLETAGIRMGSRIVVSGSRLGEADTKPLITGEVTAIEADYDTLGGRAVVRGYDPSHRLHRGRITATYRNVTDSDIVRTVARRAGVEIGTVDESGTTHDHVSQANSSDWEFLQSRAREIGYHLSFDAGKLRVPQANAGDRGPGGGRLRFAGPARARDGQGAAGVPAAHHVLGAGRPRWRCAAWDPVKKQTMVATAPASASKRQAEH